MVRADGVEDYEDEPYAELTYQLTHPDGFATIGALLGLATAPVETCRVLELGCASGANIIAMAEALPGASFTGVDLSPRQVADGRAMAAELGVRNVELLAGDIRDLETLAPGSFDYVIAHGVYSWVPGEVREALLANCRRLLAPNGIACISYNAYPGWAPLHALREMMLHHTRNAASPRERATRAEALYRLLQRANPPAGSSFGHFLAEYEAHVDGRHALGGDRASSLLLHDELAGVNEPVYFHEFADHAARHSLQYLADADFPTVFPSRLAPEVQAELRKLAATPVEHQQYLDFLSNATFKQTLLFHEERTVSRRVGASIEPLRRMFAASPAKPVMVAAGREPTRFDAADGAKLSPGSPAGRAALGLLTARYPARVPFDELVADVRERLGGAAPDEESAALQVAETLLQGFCYSASLVELRTTAGSFTVTPGMKPHTPAFARRQLAQGFGHVTNLRHERVTVDGLIARLITLFDGTRTRDEALREAGDGSNRSARRFEQAVRTLTEMALFLE